MAWGREAAGGVRVFAVAADAAASAPVSDVQRVLTVERRPEAAPTPPLHDPIAASTVRPVALAPVVAVESQEAPARATGEVAQARAFDDDADDEPVPTPRVVRTPRSLPMTRADCEDGIRPCPYVSCRHHLLWVSEDPAKELDEFYDRVVVADNGEGLPRSLAYYAPIPEFETEEPADEKQEAETGQQNASALKSFIEAAKASGVEIKSIGIDWRETARRCNVALINTGDEEESEDTGKPPVVYMEAQPVEPTIPAKPAVAKMAAGREPESEGERLGVDSEPAKILWTA
jgi:hypothetical protein